jgi:hypothetical protein
MPELAHETPSQHELDAYLREHLSHSMFAAFGMTPEQLSQSFPAGVAEAFISLGRLDGQAFALRAFEATFAGLNRMNSLPRSDEFWLNTNRRPTIYKLPDFCRMKLIEDPRDPEALWVAAIIPVWFGHNDFGQEAWLELSRLPGFEARWPLCAALTVHLTAHFTEEQVSDFLREADATREATPILRRIADEGEGLCVTWANRVLHLVKDPAEWPAVGRT